MLGVFNYTVILTYLSLISAVLGIVFGFNGNDFAVVICLLFCGLCDMLDGRVARNKKNRTQFEKNFGIQIDSLSDLIAFGLLPVILGLSFNMCSYLYVPIYAIFVLAGLIRLAYFNSNCIDEKGYNGFIGLPITASALIFPILYLFRKYSFINILYPLILLITSLLYLLKFKFKKPGIKAVCGLLFLGVIEVICVLFIH